MNQKLQPGDAIKCEAVLNDFTEATTRGVIWNFEKFTGKHLRKSLFLNKAIFKYQVNLRELIHF